MFILILMDAINSHSMINDFTDDMGILLYFVGEDCRLMDANRLGIGLLRQFDVGDGPLCPQLFTGLNEQNHDCPRRELSEGGRSSAVKEMTLKNGQVKKVIYRLTPDRDGYYIAISDLYEDSQSESLLKQNERLKRVLLDNLESSFIICDENGIVDKSHFVGGLSDVMGKKGFADALPGIFNTDISQVLIAKFIDMSSRKQRELCHFKWMYRDHVFWLDVYITAIGERNFFLSVQDKTEDHYLLEKLERLGDAESRCQKIYDITSKVANLIGGIGGYANMAKVKNSDPGVAEILESISKVSQESVSMMKIILDQARWKEGDEKSISEKGTVVATTGTPDSAFQYIAVDRALELLENNNELYYTVVEDFLKDYSDVGDRLSLLMENDREGAQILVHSIKGVSGILGAYSLQDESSLLESYLRHGEFDKADERRTSFISIMEGVLKELRLMNRGGGKINDDDKWNLHGMVLNSHQKDLLKEIIPLAEAGDYNDLHENIRQFSLYNWGDDWKETMRIMANHVEDINFEGVLHTIYSLIE